MRRRLFRCCGARCPGLEVPADTGTPHPRSCLAHPEHWPGAAAFAGGEGGPFRRTDERGQLDVGRSAAAQASFFRALGEGAPWAVSLQAEMTSPAWPPASFAVIDVRRINLAELAEDAAGERQLALFAELEHERVWAERALARRLLRKARTIAERIAGDVARGERFSAIQLYDTGAELVGMCPCGAWPGEFHMEASCPAERFWGRWTTPITQRAAAAVAELFGQIGALGDLLDAQEIRRALCGLAPLEQESRNDERTTTA